MRPPSGGVEANLSPFMLPPAGLVSAAADSGLRRPMPGGPIPGTRPRPVQSPTLGLGSSQRATVQTRLPYPARYLLHGRESEHDAREVLAGLRNLGNTCYLNAVLCCLLHLPAFVRALRSVELWEEVKRVEEEEVAAVVAAMTAGDDEDDGDASVGCAAPSSAKLEAVIASDDEAALTSPRKRARAASPPPPPHVFRNVEIVDLASDPDDDVGVGAGAAATAVASVSAAAGATVGAAAGDGGGGAAAAVEGGGGAGAGAGASSAIGDGAVGAAAALTSIARGDSAVHSAAPVSFALKCIIEKKLGSTEVISPRRLKEVCGPHASTSRCCSCGCSCGVSGSLDCCRLRY
jgi:hypothetical protein